MLLTISRTILLYRVQRDNSLKIFIEFNSIKKDSSFSFYDVALSNYQISIPYRDFSKRFSNFMSRKTIVRILVCTSLFMSLFLWHFKDVSLMSSQFYWYFYTIIINWSRFLRRFYFTINLGKIHLKKKKNWHREKIE